MIRACIPSPCDRSEFSWLQELEDAAPDITREIGSLVKAGRGQSYRGGTGEMSTVYDATRGWSTMRIRYMGRCANGGGSGCSSLAKMMFLRTLFCYMYVYNRVVCFISSFVACTASPSTQNIMHGQAGVPCIVIPRTLHITPFRCIFSVPADSNIIVKTKKVRE